jgi:hypothetical protein
MDQEKSNSNWSTYVSEPIDCKLKIDDSESPAEILEHLTIGDEFLTFKSTKRDLLFLALVF